MLLSSLQAAAKPESCRGALSSVLSASAPQDVVVPKALRNHQLVLMMEQQIYDAKEQTLEPRGDCGWGFNNPAIGLEFALHFLACLPGFSKKTSVAGGKKNEAKQVVCATHARRDGGRCLCTGVEPRVDGGCCDGQKCPCQAQLREPRVVRRLGLVSPAPSLASRSRAVTSELIDSGRDDLQSPSPCMQAWHRLQAVLQLMDALLGF